jgi:catechol 2,3-dioxygenase-like lactoylglutathione lyase family enzyme
MTVAVTGIHHLLIETHNFGKSVAFWRQLGWDLAEDHGDSGKLVGPSGGAHVWLSEVAPSKTPVIDVYFEVTEADAFAPRPPVEVVEPFAATHWGTKLMTVRDPDGRIVRLQAR